MIKRIGTVVSVLQNHVRVAIVPEVSTPTTELAPSACCRPAADAGGEEVDAASKIALHNGDRVEVLVPEPRNLGALLAPLLPAVVMSVAGAVVGGLLWGDAGTGIGIAAGLALGVVGTLLVGRWMRGGSRDKARVLRVVGSGEPVEHCAACAASSQRR